MWRTGDVSHNRSERYQGYWTKPAVPHIQMNIMIEFYTNSCLLFIVVYKAFHINSKSYFLAALLVVIMNYVTGVQGILSSWCLHVISELFTLMILHAV